MGVNTDITYQKWAESVQAHRLSDALESKRQQENFMDMTSHEMRNPLNAILQCAEEISNLLGRVQSSGGYDKIQSAVIRDCIEEAQTILYCGYHQKVSKARTLSSLRCPGMSQSLIH